MYWNDKLVIMLRVEFAPEYWNREQLIYSEKHKSAKEWTRKQSFMMDLKLFTKMVVNE